MASTTTPEQPRIRVRRAVPDDVPDLVRIHFDAFGPGIMNRLMYPDGGSASARASFGKSFFPPSPAGQPVPQVETVTMVAEMLPEEEIVAFAKWRLVKEPLPEETWDAAEEPMTAEMLGEGVDVDVYRAFIGDLHRLRKRWMRGDPCVYLSILACSTSRQRLGAGSALLKWGVELADAEGKVAWLEASPHGYPLYRRFGFEDIEVQDLKVTELWGSVREEHENWGENSAVAFAGELPRGTARTVFMRRLPQKTE